MPGFNTIPGSSGGGSAGALNFVASVHMSTYNRSWAQAGVSGNYGIYSADGSSGYAYFIGTSMTTGVSMNRVVNVPHSFTSINIVAPQGDLVSLYKAKVKSTTLFSNPLAAMTVNPAVLIASGNFALPTNATVPFADITVVGAGGAAGGGHGATHGGGGGGGGGNIINLTDYPVYGTTIVSIGFGGTGIRTGRGGAGGQSAFGPVYALGGGGGGGWDTRAASTGGNGGGGGAGGSEGLGAAGITQNSSSGLGAIGSPVFRGGYSGGAGNSSTGQASRGGGGGGALGSGTNGSSNSGGNGGAGWSASITGSSATFGAGGYGSDPNSNGGTGWSGLAYGCGGQSTTNGHSADTPIGSSGQNGVVVVRFYTP